MKWQRWPGGVGISKAPGQRIPAGARIQAAIKRIRLQERERKRHPDAPPTSPPGQSSDMTPRLVLRLDRVATVTT